MALIEIKPLFLYYRTDEVAKAIEVQTKKESEALHQISSSASVMFDPGISQDTPIGHFPRTYTFVNQLSFDQAVTQMARRGFIRSPNKE